MRKHRKRSGKRGRRRERDPRQRHAENQRHGHDKRKRKKNGIKVSKGLSIADSTINLTAGNHALSARFIEAENAKINVLSAGKDALNAECDDKTQEFTLGEGYVSLKSSKVFASVSGDGIQADTFVYITGGSVDIKPRQRL